jgi:hypothetical protein
MIEQHNGQIRLGDHVLMRGLTRADFVQQFPSAMLDWEHGSRCAYALLLSGEDWQIHVTVYFEEAIISSTTLIFSDSSFDEALTLSDLAAIAAREQRRAHLHADLLREWFGSPPPYRFSWGTVASAQDNPYSNRMISVQYL